jgi:hypothetical protein
LYLGGGGGWGRARHEEVKHISNRDKEIRRFTQGIGGTMSGKKRGKRMGPEKESKSLVFEGRGWLIN